MFWLDPHTSQLRAVASLLEQGGELLWAANPSGAVVYSSEPTTRAVEEAAPTPAETAAPQGSSANPPGA